MARTCFKTPVLVLEPLALLLDVVVRLRALQPHPAQRLHQQLADRPVAVPLAVARYDVPRGRVGVAALERDLVGLLVVGPVRPLVDVVGLELPLLVGLVESRQQSLLLLAAEMWSMHLITTVLLSTSGFSQSLIAP